ncbi:unnamed protein product [Ambrosiozyma monospora]|uniref:Unnamed protein product n=1 Tax=Ambrosiozyma monospora TaxID=43982 RepID=A0A9W6T1T1_AMBMO|nr:unnamed protein product [Ambrosiozyma monospora]
MSRSYQNQAETESLLGINSTTSTPPRPSPRRRQNIDDDFVRGTNLKRYTSNEIFRVANQSVDELLNEMKSQGQISADTSLLVSEAGTASPLTEPLKLEQQQQQQHQQSQQSISHHPSTPSKSSRLQEQYQDLNSEKLDRIIDHPHGPRVLRPSPIKTPNGKHVMVDSDSVHIALDELDSCSLKDAEKLSIDWSDVVPLKTLNTVGLTTGKPLPPIAHSCSLKSLPGLAYQQPVDSVI